MIRILVTPRWPDSQLSVLSHLLSLFGLKTLSTEVASRKVQGHR